MSADLGRKIILEWGGAEIPGVREKSIALNGEAINTSSDEDNGWQTLLEESGEQNVEVSISGVTKSNALRADWFAGDRMKAAEITFPNGDIISGTFRMSSYTDTGPYNDAMTFETTLQSHGAVTYTPYS